MKAKSGSSSSSLRLTGCVLVSLFVLRNVYLLTDLMSGSRNLRGAGNENASFGGAVFFSEHSITQRSSIKRMEQELNATQTQLQELMGVVAKQSSRMDANEKGLKQILLRERQLSKDDATTLDDDTSSQAKENVGGEQLPKQQQESVAACLLIKDDNHWLIEWLAFHYHVLPLRDLAVLVDPGSRTSPQRILDRWEGLMNIEVWNSTALDAKVGDPKQLMDRLTGKKNPATDRQRHNARQITFYNQCLQSFAKAGNKSWVMLTDTDEFAYPNVRASSHQQDVDVSKPGSFLRFVNDEKKHRGGDALPSCIQAPRYQFGANKSKKKAINKNMPVEFGGKLSGKDFLTTQWLFRWEHEMKYGKNFVNVSQLKKKDYDQMSYSVHSVLTGICPALPGKKEKIGLPVTDPQSLAVVHHYIGTPEQFFFRDDPRNKEGGRVKYNKSDKPAVANSDVVRTWLTGFVNTMGADEAYRLLEGVGKVGYEG